MGPSVRLDLERWFAVAMHTFHRLRERHAWLLIAAATCAGLSVVLLSKLWMEQSGIFTRWKRWRSVIPQPIA